MSTAVILDDDALHHLGEQLGDSGILCGFLDRYLALLEQRIARLERALAAADRDDWIDAVLSLKTSSAMAGAQALTEEAARLQRESACWPWWCTPTRASVTRRAECISGLRRLAAETARQLRAFLLQVADSTRAADSRCT
ncbi:MAG: Hpt domain-containing protein [Brachybacterium sp.]|nr:Hpt domain-containing protein [Brachybacterium sp.]